MRSVELISAILALSVPLVTAVSEDRAPRPNIVFILADDLGYGELGCYGQEKIKTPRIDRMAAEGMRFTDHYAGYNVCSPSRACLMTGKHLGHVHVGQGGSLKKQDITVAMLLKEAGYATCMIGKWGLVGRPGHPGSPNNKGFDHWFGYDNQGFAHFYYREFLWRNDRKVLYRRHQLRAGAAGESAGQKEQEYFYWIWAVPVGKWKLHPAGKEKYRLYDLEKGIAEQHDVADRLPDVVARCSRYFQIARGNSA